MENFVTRTTAIVTRTITIVIQEIFPQPLSFLTLSVYSFEELKKFQF